MANVFRSTVPNLSINGLPPSPTMVASMLTSSSYHSTSVIEEHEPFDSRLWDKAKDYARQEEDLIEEIAALRRKMPGVAVEGAKKAYRDGMEADETTLKNWTERMIEQDGVNSRKDGTGVLGVGELERLGEVERTWTRGVSGLEGLQRTLPEVVAKGDRAKRAEDYVLTREKK